MSDYARRLVYETERYGAAVRGWLGREEQEQAEREEWRLNQERLAVEDEREGLERRCENCGSPAVGVSLDEVPLCRRCGEELERDAP